MHMSNRGRIFFILALSIAFLARDVDRCIVIALFMTGIAIANKRAIEFDIGDLLIFLVPAFYNVIYGSGVADGLFLGMGYVAMYQLGKFLIPESGNSKESGTGSGGIVMTVLIPTLILAVKGLLGYLYVLRNGSISVERAWPDWGGDMMHRNHHEYWMVMPAALLIYFIILIVLSFRKKSTPEGFESCFESDELIRFTGIIGVVLSVGIVLVTIYGGGRLTLCACYISAFVVVLGIAIRNKLFTESEYRLYAIGGIVLSLVPMILYMIFSDTDSSSVMLQQIRLSLAHPFLPTADTPLITVLGEETGSAGNTWLQMARQGGLISALPAIAFTVMNIYWLVKVWKRSRNIGIYAVTAAFVGVTWLNMIESVVLTYEVFWCLEIYIGGLIRGMYNEVTDEK